MHPHGTRARYQSAQCRCRLCQIANNTYQQSIRARHARGLPLAGQLVSRRPVDRLLKACAREWLTKARLARELGQHDARLRFGQRVRRGTLDALQKLADTYEIAS